MDLGMTDVNLADALQAKCAEIVELEEQLLHSARAGQLLLDKNEQSEYEVQRLTDLVKSLECQVEDLHDELSKVVTPGYCEKAEEEIQRLSDLVDKLDEQNTSLQHERDEGHRRFEAEVAELKEELHNSNRLRECHESKHIEHGEELEEECEKLRVQCQSLRDSEESLRSRLQEAQAHEQELKREIVCLKSKGNRNRNRSNSRRAGPRNRNRSTSVAPSQDISCSLEKIAAATDAKENLYNSFEIEISELDSQLNNARQENTELKIRVQELEAKLEEADQYTEELCGALASTEERSRLLELDAHEVQTLLHEVRRNSRAEQLQTCDFHHRNEAYDQPEEEHQDGASQGGDDSSSLSDDDFIPLSGDDDWSDDEDAGESIDRSMAQPGYYLSQVGRAFNLEKAKAFWSRLSSNTSESGAAGSQTDGSLQSIAENDGLKRNLKLRGGIRVERETPMTLPGVESW